MLSPLPLSIWRAHLSSFVYAARGEDGKMGERRERRGGTEGLVPPVCNGWVPRPTEGKSGGGARSSLFACISIIFLLPPSLFLPPPPPPLSARPKLTLAQHKSIKGGFCFLLPPLPSPLPFLVPSPLSGLESLHSGGIRRCCCTDGEEEACGGGKGGKGAWNEKGEGNIGRSEYEQRGGGEGGDGADPSLPRHRGRGRRR